MPVQKVGQRSGCGPRPAATRFTEYVSAHSVHGVAGRLLAAGDRGR